LRFCIALDEDAPTAEPDKSLPGNRFSARTVQGGIEVLRRYTARKAGTLCRKTKASVHLGLVRIDLGKAILNRVEEAFCLIRLNVCVCVDGVGYTSGTPCPNKKTSLFEKPRPESASNASSSTIEPLRLKRKWLRTANGTAFAVWGCLLITGCFSFVTIYARCRKPAQIVCLPSPCG
jgi:hypothetical protein